MGTRPARRHRAALSLVLACLVAGPVGADPEPLDHFPTGSVTVESGGHAHTFRVWIAATEPRRNQGLMYVKSLAPTRGMLFVFDAPQVTAFWMKNTLIPLDLLFIASDGRIVRIAENATPLSEANISSMGVVTTVLEVAGGTAQRLHIAAGDHVRYAPFGSH